MLSVINELCKALSEKVIEGKRQGVSRFITDDLPQSVIDKLQLRREDLPSFGVALLVFVLDNSSPSRWSPEVNESWNFVTEDDLAAARTELADTQTSILVVLPQGRNIAATMDSTTRKIGGVFESVALSIANFLGLNKPNFLHDVLCEIAREEGAGDPDDMDSIRWDSLLDLNGLPEASGLSDTVTARLGLLSGTTEANWRKVKRCWKEVVKHFN